MAWGTTARALGAPASACEVLGTRLGTQWLAQASCWRCSARAPRRQWQQRHQVRASKASLKGHCAPGCLQQLWRLTAGVGRSAALLSKPALRAVAPSPTRCRCRCRCGVPYPPAHPNLRPSTVQPARAALLDPPPFDPSKLSVEYLPGGREAALGRSLRRRYTLTHNDVTGSLQLSIGACVGAGQPADAGSSIHCTVAVAGG